MGKIAAVAGNLASGKSTLARALAQHHGWAHIPNGNYDESYLTDLFTDPGRWSFEAQMSFLHHKAEAIRTAMAGAETVVLDRSLAEDVLVFAGYFHRRGWMSDRAHGLYLRFAQPLLDELAEPDLIVYCYAPAEECEARLLARPRPYQALFPADHIRVLHEIYEAWWPAAPGKAKHRIDTTAIDLRRPQDAVQVAQCIGGLLSAV